MMAKQFKNRKSSNESSLGPAGQARKQSGQTLIETIVAISLLTTGIVGGLSLAIFALGASDVSLNQIIATNLAREGVEVVRNMRDTNWLTDSLRSCSSQIGAGQQCYRDWDDQVYNIRGRTNGRYYRLQFSSSSNSWRIRSSSSRSTRNRLYLQSNGTYTDSNNGNWRFSRRIRIFRDNSAPFSSSNPRLRIESIVWWHGKNCSTTDNPNNTNCKVVVEELLTNWKNY